MLRSSHFVVALSMRSVRRYIFLISVLMGALTATAFAQDPTAGIQPFSTQIGGAYDSIDAATSSIFVSIPVRSKTGKIPFSFNLPWTSHAWNSLNPSYFVDKTPEYLWSVNTTLSNGLSMQTTLGNPLQHCAYEGTGMNSIISEFYVIDPTGAQHYTNFLSSPLNRGFNTSCGTNVFPQTVTTTDGSGYTVIVTGFSHSTGLSATIYDKSGNIVTTPAAGPAVLVQDADGAQITSQSVSGGTAYTDTLGATALTWILAQGYQWQDASGTTQTVQPVDSSYMQQTAFGCPPYYGNIQLIGDISPSQIYLPSSVTTPEGTFSFTYETTPNDTHTPHYVTGRLASITAPNGAIVSYTYSGGNNGVYCDTNRVGTVPTLTRSIYDPVSNVTTTTTFSNSNNGAVTVTDNAGNQTQYSFKAEAQFEKQVWEGAAGVGTLLETVFTCSNGSNTSQSACSGLSTTGGATAQTDVYTYPGTSSSPSLVETIYDCKTVTPCYGNVVSVSQYGFGATVPASGSPVSTTTTTYNIPSGGVYPCGTLSNPYMFDRPCSITTTNSSGAMVSQTKYTYNTPGHVTSTSNWVSGTGTNAKYLTTSTTYNSNGTVNVSTDANNTTNTYSYNGACNSLMPTSVLISGTNVSLSRSMSWDCNGGVQTSLIDENGKTTSTHFYNGTAADPYYRPVSTVDPLLNTANYSYSATTVESAMNFNGAVSTADVINTTDGLGRTIYSQTRQAQASSNFDSTQTTYGWTPTTSTVAGGPYTKQSVLYQGAQGQSAPANTAVTTTQLDALNRPITVTDGGGGTVSYTYVQNDVLQKVGPTPTFQKQSEYDGLGRLTSVCEITSASGSGSCGQANAATGFLTKYTYDALGNLLTVAQNVQPGAIGGSQNRTYTFDGLSRLTSEINPEPGTGATTYTYDSYPAGTCGGMTTSPGDLMLKTLPNGNTLCYIHDGLHRLTDEGNYSPTIQADCVFSPCRRFRYDNNPGYFGTPSGVTVSNTLGRVADVLTDSAVNSRDTQVTDEWFSYDADGRPTDLYQSTPSSGGYYHISTGPNYWANGALKTLNLYNSSGASLLPTISYGVDGEGRPTTVTASSGQSPVTGVTYVTSNGTGEPIGSLTGVTFGSQDSDAFKYDPNTGRMTYYGFNVNSQTASGTLGWNANGTLGTLAITDPFNSLDNQSCSYGYDGLGRITGDNCGSVWAQTFSYDAFGNISKSGSISWQPTYNAPANNQYLTGWNGVQYDGNGNLLSDPFNTYTWDAYGDLATANGVSVTYDGFGRMVENSSGTYEFVYPPAGGQVLSVMSGQGVTSAEVPLPGGAFAVYISSGLYQYNHPDRLGSAKLFSTPTRGAIAAMSYAPFGEGYAGGQQWIQFTSSGNAWTVADNENQGGSLEDFTFRRYNPTQGRWISPDPAGLAAANPANPQSWNRYSYVLNNPLSFTDPTGLWCVWEDGTHDDNPSNGGAAQGDCTDQGGHWDNFDTITGIFQQNGIVTQINTIYGNCTSSECGAGTTLEGFDQTLASYSQQQSNNGAANNGWSFLGQNSTWWKTFLKEAVQPWKDQCAGVFANAFANGGIVNAVSENLEGAPDPDEVIKQAGSMAAAQYVVNNGLVCPGCSATYRAIVSGTETAATSFVLADSYYRIGQGYYAEYNAFKAGTCQ